MDQRGSLVRLVEGAVDGEVQAPEGHLERLGKAQVYLGVPRSSLSVSYLELHSFSGLHCMYYLPSCIHH